MRSGSELPQHLFPSRILIILHLSTLQGANGVIMLSAGSNRSWGGRPTPRLRGAGDSGLRPLALAIRPFSDLLEANRQWCPSEGWRFRPGVVGQMLQCRQITGALVIQSRNQEARLQSRLCPQHGVLKARTQTANIGALHYRSTMSPNLPRIPEGENPRLPSSGVLGHTRGVAYGQKLLPPHSPTPSTLYPRGALP